MLGDGLERSPPDLLEELALMVAAAAAYSSRTEGLAFLPREARRGVMTGEGGGGSSFCFALRDFLDLERPLGKSGVVGEGVVGDVGVVGVPLAVAEDAGAAPRAVWGGVYESE